MPASPVMLIGQPTWRDTLQTLAEASGFALAVCESRADYMTRLVDDHAALIVVDGSLPDWRWWVTTPRVSPATRRIPVAVVVAANRAEGHSAYDAGADFVLAPDDLPGGLPGILSESARVQRPDEARQLADECARPLPPQAVEALARFNAGEYYAQHDLLEALWRQESGPVRDLYRAILQVGIAYYQITRGNREGALKMLLRARQWLNILPDVCQGVDVARLREDSERVRRALADTPEERIAEFDRALLAPVRMVSEL